jgi:1,4-dihydroxy-2-naphthoate octaprenyltransferase
LAGAAGLAVVLSIILTAVLVLALGVHWAIFLFVAWGLLSGIEYSLPPLRISYLGGGEFVVLVTYGIALVGAGYFVQAGPILTLLPLALGLPIGFAVFALIAITQFPDRESDQKAGKRSLVILLGEKRTLGLIAAAVMLSMFSVLVFLVTGAIPFWAGILSLLLGLPLAANLLRIIVRREPGPGMFMQLSQGSIMLTLWLGVAPALGLLLDRWLR